MKIKNRFAIDAACFLGLGLVLILCGLSTLTWQYWVIYIAALIVGLVQWTCGLKEGGQ